MLLDVFLNPVTMNADEDDDDDDDRRYTERLRGGEARVCMLCVSVCAKPNLFRYATPIACWIL